MSDHETLQELLPWFVNGTLNEEQQSAVSRHLESCPTCSRDVDELVQIAARFKTPGPEDLAARARENARGFTATLPAQGSPAQDHKSPNRRTGIVVAACCAILVTGFIATITVMPPTMDFRALSRTGAVHDTAIIQVVFSERATEKEIRRVLLDEGQSVLSGPTRQGVYRIELDSNLDAKIRLARLRDEPSVIFAEVEQSP